MAFLEQSQRILLPVNRAYIALTFVLALLFNLLPWRDVTWLPDMVALVLIFWCVHQPRKIGIGIAWFLGLIMDAGNGALLGQHALAYAVLAFAATGLHRRILWFSLLAQGFIAPGAGNSDSHGIIDNQLGWARNSSYLLLWIRDEGPGISNPANLFVPFFTTKPGGSGIGLVLCRQIAEAHGGNLTVENCTAARGCRAQLRLPLRASAH